jgi:glycosyltransferase involved in cell wall biosynthesis
MKVSVIVCTRDRAKMLAECLSSLLRNQYANAEIIVVDQSTSDETERQVKASRGDQRLKVTTQAVIASGAKQSPSHKEEIASSPKTLLAMTCTEQLQLKYIRSETVGLSRARNIGIEASDGKIISFTDDDCLVSEDWIESIAAEFQKDPQVMAVYGRILPLGVSWADPPVAIKESEEYEVVCGKANPWRLGHGANMSFRRQVFTAVGRFDELLGPGAALKNCDDADMTYRVLKKGYKAIYSPNVLNYHQQWRAPEEIGGLEQSYAIGTGALYIKHLRCGDLYTLRLMVDKIAWMLTSGLSRWLRSPRRRSVTTQAVIARSGFCDEAISKPRVGDCFAPLAMTRTEQSQRPLDHRPSRLSFVRRIARKGYCEVVYTLYGMFLGLRKPVDKKHLTYVD